MPPRFCFFRMKSFVATDRETCGATTKEIEERMRFRHHAIAKSATTIMSSLVVPACKGQVFQYRVRVRS
jgi:hypothetical protein